MSITSINTNYEALFARQNILSQERIMNKSMARISTGKRIVTAADDPTGISMLTLAKADLRGTQVAQQNIQESYEVLQFVDAMLGQLEDTIIEMQAIAIRQGNDATLSTTDQANLAAEYAALFSSMNATSMSSITWNTKTVMQGGLANAWIQYGGNANTRNQLTSATFTANYDAASLGVQATCTTGNAAAAITAVGTALQTLGNYRATYGSTMEVLEAQLSNQMAMESAYTSTVSTIGDADMAAEISSFTKTQILAQAATAMLAQANASPQMVMQLF